MKATLVAERNPFKQDMLSQNECYILDNGGNRKIFVWKGTSNNRLDHVLLALKLSMFAHKSHRQKTSYIYYI